MKRFIRSFNSALVEFRDSPTERCACIKGSSLAIWEVMMVARDYKHNARKVANHLGWLRSKVQVAFDYAQKFPEEIKSAIADNDAMDFAALSKTLPQATEFVVNGKARVKKRSNRHDRLG